MKKSNKLFDFKSIIMTLILVLAVVIPSGVVFAVNNQVVKSGGSNTEKWNSDGVQVSKTATPTGVEDYFDITLQVKSKNSVKAIMDSYSAAVVFVVDLSGSMDNYINPKNSSSGKKVTNAISAIQLFTQEFYDYSKTDYPNNQIGAVGFNTNGHDLVGLTKVSNYESFNSTLNNKITNVIDTAASYDEFTNIEAGLKKAQAMLDTSTAKHKYIVFLGDGVPTTYIRSGYTGYQYKKEDTTFADNKNGITGQLIQYPGANYSDTGAKRARAKAMELKKAGVTIYSIGVGLQTFWGYKGSNQDTNSTIAYRSHYNYELNGEQLLVNQLARSITKGQQHVENTFGKVNGTNTWQAKKSAILSKRWEITNSFENCVNGTGEIGWYRNLIDDNYTKTTNEDLFKRWLTYGIGSGYYYDVTKISDFEDIIRGKNGILEKLKSDLNSKRTDVWSTTDPMTNYNTTTSDYIKFVGFLNASGNTIPETSISGSHVKNGNNTAEFKKNSSTDPAGTITWNLKNSGFTTEEEDSVYVYTLKYRVRLKVEKQGFSDTISYDTNGTTTLTYINLENGVAGDIKTINYPIPKVKGYLENLKITKTVEGIASGKTLPSANSTFTYRVTFKDSSGGTVDNEFTYDKYKGNSTTSYESGTMTKDNRTFTLGNNESIVIHNLYHDITWTVTENAHDGFKQTITSVSPNTITKSGVTATGTTKSAISLYEVNYKNKTYQLKLKKFDGDTSKNLQGVKFTLYSSLDGSGNPINPVTNMNGELLENLTTDTDGMIDLGNLSFTAGGSTTYYLKEVDTIDKYNLLDTYITVVVNENGITSSYAGHDFDKSKSKVQTISLNENMFEIDVPNIIGITLPETGGDGGLLIKKVGLLLIIFACIGYILTERIEKNNKRRGNNKMKKYLGLMFTFLLSIVMVGNVYAKMTGDSFTITINDTENGHKYEAYQILTGDVSIEEANKTTHQKYFSNIEWGDGVTEEFKTATGSPKAYAETIKDYANDSTDAINVTKILAKKLSNKKYTSGSFDSANNKYTISVPKAGYYLVREMKTNADGKKEYMGTGYIVNLADNIEVTPKRSIPVPTKVIDEGNGVHASSKYAVGENVPFKLTGTMPENYDFFETYKYVFHDTLSSGLQFNKDSVKVYVENDGTKSLVTSGYNVDTTDSNYTFSIVFKDTKKDIKGENNSDLSITQESKIIVEYNATVLNTAVRGTDGNSNKMLIEYSNNPGTDETGKTSTIETKVYIFDLELKKIGSDKNNSPLANARFKLERQKADKSWEVVRGITYSADTPVGTHTFYGLSEGTYRVTEIQTPDGYNTIVPFTFTVTPNYNESVTALNKVTLNTTISDEVPALAFDSSDTKYTTMKSTITNFKGITLPLTGGMGSTIFTIVGLALMTISIITLIKNRKENN